MEPFEDIISDEEYEQFKIDFSKKKYIPWVEKYPDEALSIFISVLQYSNNVTCDDVRYFQGLGVDINEPCELYPGDSGNNNLLTYACEYHEIKLMKVAIECGANVNIKIDDNTPLLALLQGHDPSYTRHHGRIKEGLKLLQDNGVEKVLPKWISDYADNYDRDIKKFIKSCSIRKRW